MNIDIEKERANFEAACRQHAKDAGYDDSERLERDGDGYADLYTQAAWWAWQARAAIEANRKQRFEKGDALKRYKECGADEEQDPIERLRFFCSLAMSGQDWLDSEQFFDDLIADRQRRGEPVAYRLLRKNADGDWVTDGRRWCDGMPDGDLVRDVAKSGQYRIEYAYAAPQPTEPVKTLIDNQEPLGEKFQRVLDEHSWDLYVKTAEPVSQHPDDAAVDAFAVQMKAKLKRSREAKGRSGPGDQPAEPVGEVLGKTCIDGGKCHHGCKERCFRRQCCDPFSDYSGPWEYAAETMEKQA